MLARKKNQKRADFLYFIITSGALSVTFIPILNERLVAKNKEEAWELLKWWTSAETQTRYNNNVESILGMIGRTTTANVEAFQNLAWDKEHLEVLEAQRLQVKEVPEVPGSYYLSRAVDQAFWSVVNGESNSKDAVMKWSKVADDEIARKIKEYQ